MDGRVDLNDLNIVLNNLGTSATSWSSGNFDGAATIDLTDLNSVLNNLGLSNSPTETATSSGISSVPEPASTSVLGLGLLAIALRCKRRSRRVD